MNEKFLELPKEKQLRIINSGMEHFGKYGYKNAKTDDIACQAGISKGLLFYYFKNKKSFYMYLYSFCEKILKEKLIVEDLQEITDFFDILEYGSLKKVEMIQEYPFMLNFMIKFFYYQKGTLNKDIQQILKDLTLYTYDFYFQNVDWYKFKDDVDPKDIYLMLIWLFEGYLFERQRSEMKITADELTQQFAKWVVMFKKMSYKEEYL